MKENISVWCRHGGIRLPGLLVVLAAAAAILAADSGIAPTDPWKQADLIEPEALAKILREGKSPAIFYVGFPVLYRTVHLPGAQFAGPGSKESGLQDLRKALANVPRDKEIVIYCGCCPWAQCPNIRPAFRVVQEMGFRRAKVLVLPTNVPTDWTGKGYPVERAEKPPK